MCASKLQFVCISALTTRPKVCPRSWLPLSSKTLNIIHTLKWRLLPMRIDKVSTVHEQPKSKDLETRGWLTRPTNRSVVARQRYKSLDGAWMEDILWSATKIREFPRNAVREKKMLTADKSKEYCCNWPAKEEEQTSSSNVFICVPSPVDFVAVITLQTFQILSFRLSVICKLNKRDGKFWAR